MRSFVCFAVVAMLALPAAGGAQGTKKQPGKTVLTKATYMVSGMH